MMDGSVDLLEVWEGIDAKNDRSGFFFLGGEFIEMSKCLCPTLT